MTDPSPTLHAVTPPDPARGGLAAGELLYAAIAASAGVDDRTLVLGTSADRDAAALLGVREPRLTPRPRHPTVAASAIRRTARMFGAGRVRLWSRELLHASPGIGRAATVEACLLDLPGDNGADSWRPLRRTLAPLDRLIVPDTRARDRWIEVGARADLVEILDPDPIPLPADRASARAGLGLSDSITIAPLSADPRRVDARALTFVSGVLELLGHEHTLILPDRGQRAAAAVRFRRQTALRTRFVFVPRPMLEILPAADVLIAPAWGDAPSPVRAMLESHAADLGIPVAVIAGWETDPGLAHGTLSPNIRENVGPVIAAYESAAPAACPEAG